MTADLEFNAAYSATTGEHVPSWYVPTVTLSSNADVLIDDIPRERVTDWHTLTGHRYNGASFPVFEPAECADDETIRQWIREAGGDVFALVTVEAPCDAAAPCFPDDPDYCEQFGCDAAPAGWAVLYRNAGE